MRRSKRHRYHRGEPDWVRLSDRALLDLRFCDLDLKIERSELQPRIRQLYDELEKRGLRLRPPCWLSSEWFSPHDTPGIAIPFYLAHPRLRELESRMMKEVEGGTKNWCMQLLRHEAGHAYETAYRLTERKQWQRLFGRASRKYPEYYSPKPLSRNFVLHLDWWYAQSHPVEDFAETFAVWLRPGSQWRKDYKDWPALAKLEYVDEIMRGIAGKPALVRPGPHMEPLRQLRQTLREHYRQKQERYGGASLDFFDLDLRRLFPPSPRRRTQVSAARFLRRISPKLRQRVAAWTGGHAYVVNLVLKDMIQRSRELGLRVSRPEDETKLGAAIVLTMRTMNDLYIKGHHLVL
jgi:hypothetical protein